MTSIYRKFKERLVAALLNRYEAKLYAEFDTVADHYSGHKKRIIRIPLNKFKMDGKNLILSGPNYSEYEVVHEEY